MQRRFVEHPKSMLIPIADDDRKLVKPAFVTWVLIAANVVLFLLQLSDPELTYRFAAVAKEITTGTDIVETVEINIDDRQSVAIPHRPGPTPIHLTLITSLFLARQLGTLAGKHVVPVDFRR